MADIELVIKIPEEKLSIIKNKMYCGIYDPDLYKAIANGTPLPKRHGRLIDADDIKSYFSDREGGDFTAFHFYDAVENAPTILEADTEREGY